jgi:hypothetical protein
MSGERRTSVSRQVKWWAALPLLNGLAWLTWAAATPAEQPGSALWNATHLPKTTMCLDCPRYMLLERAVDHPLRIIHPANALAWLNEIPLVLTSVKRAGPTGAPQFTGTVAAARLLVISTLQWVLVGAVVQAVASRGRAL